MSKFLYLGSENNVHDKRFVAAVEELGKVDVLFNQGPTQLEKDFESYDAIILGPISLDFGAIPENLTVPIIGMSHAFDINEIQADTQSYDKILKNLARFSLVIVDNVYIKNQLVKNFNFQSPIAVIPYGCDIEKFEDCNPDLRGNLRILSMRNWTKIHSNQIILDALSLLKDEGVVERVIFIGDGPELNAGKVFCREMNFPFQIEFMGFSESDEIVNAMKASNVYVSASRSDGSSVSLMEVMTGGLIACVTNHPSNQNLISDRENGYLYENQNPNSLAKVLREIYNLDPGARALNSERAKIYAKSKFDWSQNKLRMQQLILEVAGGK